MKSIIIVSALFLFLLSRPADAAQKFELTGDVEQEIVSCSTEVVKSTKVIESGLKASITPGHADSVIKVSFFVPRLDVSIVKDTHSERTAAVFIRDDEGKYLKNLGSIMGLVFPGKTRGGGAVSHMSGVSYYPVTDTKTRTFSLVFGPGIADLTEAGLRGDRGEYCITLQEMRPKRSWHASLFQGVTMVAQLASERFFTR